MVAERISRRHEWTMGFCKRGFPCSRPGLFHSAFLRRAFADRTAADAAAAFFALAVLSAGVMVSSDRLPPIAPPLLPCLLEVFQHFGGINLHLRTRHQLNPLLHIRARILLEQLMGV